MRALLLLLIALVATAADPATTAAVAAPVYEEVVLSTTSARVVISTNRGVVLSFQALQHRPVDLPPHLEAHGGLNRPKDEPLRLLDAARSRGTGGITSHALLQPGHTSGALLNKYANSRGVVENLALLSMADLAAWRIESHSATTVVLSYATELAAWRITHTLDATHPALATVFTIANRSATTVEVAPLLRAMDGVHFDYGPNEAYYATVFGHTGGQENGTIINLGASTQSQLTDLTQAGIGNDFDFVGVKTRFFATWWTPGPVTLRSKTLSAAGYAIQADSDQKLHAWSYGYASLKPAEHQTILVVGWKDSRRLLPGDEVDYTWTLSASGFTKQETAGLALAERRIEYTDGFYRFFKVLAKGMIWLLSSIAAVVQNYGLAVVVMTLLIKAALFRLTWKQYSSMLRMQQLQPELKKLQESSGGNKQQAALKQMELFKKHGVNPLAGCLPLLIQMPIFMALYQAFSHSAELRGVSFLWIHDLTLPDQLWGTPIAMLDGWVLSLNPLPIIYIIVSLWMGLQQKPAPGADEMQVQMAKMMRWMPAVFGLIFYNMPSGLVLYFTIQAIISTIEIKYIKKKLGMP